jgi:hypothetical protein
MRWPLEGQKAPHQRFLTLHDLLSAKRARSSRMRLIKQDLLIVVAMLFGAAGIVVVSKQSMD